MRMQKDFESNVADLEHWLREAEQAEHDALKDSFGMLIGGSFDEFEGLWDSYPRLKALAKQGWDVAGKLDLTLKTAEKRDDVLQQIAFMREIMLEIHQGLADEGLEAVIDARAATLGKFAVDYSYHMTRWGLARSQISAISDNLDSPNGALEAQKRIQILQEELMHEQQRRRQAASS